MFWLYSNSWELILFANFRPQNHEKELIFCYTESILDRFLVQWNRPSAKLDSTIFNVLQAADARKSFMALAYTKFKSAPLYLEWAPDNAFKTPAAAVEKKEGAEEKVEKVEVEQVAEDEEPGTAVARGDSLSIGIDTEWLQKHRKQGANSIG